MGIIKSSPLVHPGTLIFFFVNQRIWPAKAVNIWGDQKFDSGQHKGGYVLTLKVLNIWKFTSYCSLKPLWLGMGEVVPTLHPPLPPTVHQLSRLALEELNMIHGVKYEGVIK